MEASEIAHVHPGRLCMVGAMRTDLCEGRCDISPVAEQSGHP